MFSGLIEATASVVRVVPEPAGIRLEVSLPGVFDDTRLGDSVAVSGCCLTVVEILEGSVAFQAGRETLSRTTIGGLSEGDLVNLERSLRLGDRLGGHLVTGHIDGLGRLVRRDDEAAWSTMYFEAPQALMRQMASKGSIAIEGVSLTLVNVSDSTFSVALIPHTLSHTNLGQMAVGCHVNLETDLLAKYVQRQLETASPEVVAGRNSAI